MQGIRTLLGTSLLILGLSLPVFAGGHHSGGSSRSSGSSFRASSRSGSNIRGSAGTSRHFSGRNAAGYSTSRSRFVGAGSAARHRHRRGGHDHFVFFGDFGFPWYYSDFGYYPYGYYPYDYYPYGYYPYGYAPYGAYSQTIYPSAPVYSGDSEYYGGASRYTRSLVAKVQRQLAREGYYKGEIDGIPGRHTSYAIRAYERDHDLRVDGAISDRLMSEMGLR